jgi:hypothetical protein
LCDIGVRTNGGERRERGIRYLRHVSRQPAGRTPRAALKDRSAVRFAGADEAAHDPAAPDDCQRAVAELLSGKTPWATAAEGNV